MAKVVVVGGGFAGLSAAARLAKLRHEVTLLESGDTLGGRLLGHDVDGERWPLDPETVTLPGVFRDLFRKSGRPIERVLEMSLTSGRRHVFKDGTVLDLPMGNRGDQHDAIMAAFEEDEWSPWVDTLAEPWDLLRRNALDQVLTGPEAFDRAARKVLRPRRTIAKVADREFAEPSLRKIVLDPLRLAGQDRVTTPGFVAVTHYLERNFGRWRFEGGFPALAEALQHRLGERKVAIETGAHAHDLVTDGSGGHTVVGDRTWSADIVVWCAPTRPVSWGRPEMMQAIASSRTFLTLDADPPELADETLVHANPPIRLFRAGERRWVLEHRSGENVLDALARHDIDLRQRVVSRHDLTPSEVVTIGHWGWAWFGWRSAFRRPGVAPAAGVYSAGAHAHPGGSLESIGMATAAIAADIGPAPR